MFRLIGQHDLNSAFTRLDSGKNVEIFKIIKQICKIQSLAQYVQDINALNSLEQK